MWESGGFTAKGCRLAAALVTALIMLSCRQSPVASQTNNVSWHCEEVKGSRQPRCEQRQSLNGPPAALVEDVNAEAEKEQPGTRRPASEKPREIILVGESRPRSWRDQLPGLSVDKPGEIAPPEPQAYRDGPAPVPEPAFAKYTDANDGGSGARVETETKPQGVPLGSERPGEVNRDETAMQTRSRASAEGRRDQKGERITVQLGAFNSEKAAQEFIRANHLAHLTLETQRVKKAGQSWHVLTFGDFADKHSASKAWLAAAENAAQIDVWIRPVQP